MSGSRINKGRELLFEKRYPRTRVREEGAARLERRGKLSLTSRPVRDGSIGRCLLTKAGLDRAFQISVPARIAHFGDGL